MKALGKQMHKLNKNSHQKVSKWLKRQKNGEQPPSIADRVKKWLWNWLMDRLNFKDEKAKEAMRKAVENDMKEANNVAHDDEKKPSEL